MTTMTDAEKLAIALEALELADNIMSICGGDAWERECSEEDRRKYEGLRQQLEPAEEPVPAPAMPFACPDCGKPFATLFAVFSHSKAKHGFAGDFPAFRRVRQASASRV